MKQKRYLRLLKNSNKQKNKRKENGLFTNKNTNERCIPYALSEKIQGIFLNERRICNSTGVFAERIPSGKKVDSNSTGHRREKSRFAGACP